MATISSPSFLSGFSLTGSYRKLSLFIAPLFFLAVPFLLSRITLTANATLLDLLIATVLMLVSFKAVALWLIDTLWPVVTTYMREDFRQDFQKLKPPHKMLFIAGFFILLLYALIATVGAIR